MITASRSLNSDRGRARIEDNITGSVRSATWSAAGVGSWSIRSRLTRVSNRSGPLIRIFLSRVWFLGAFVSPRSTCSRAWMGKGEAAWHGYTLDETRGSRKETRRRRLKSSFYIHSVPLNVFKSKSLVKSRWDPSFLWKYLATNAPSKGLSISRNYFGRSLSFSITLPRHYSVAPFVLLPIPSNKVFPSKNWLKFCNHISDLPCILTRVLQWGSGNDAD